VAWPQQSELTPADSDDFFDEILHVDQCRESDVPACIAGCIVVAGVA
jgi:hypothetical protein